MAAQVMWALYPGVSDRAGSSLPASGPSGRRSGGGARSWFMIPGRAGTARGRQSRSTPGATDIMTIAKVSRAHESPTTRLTREQKLDMTGSDAIRKAWYQRALTASIRGDIETTHP